MNTHLTRQCNICKSSEPTLRACGRCKLVFYCGIEHQKQDWESEHRANCNQLTRLLKKEAVESGKLRHSDDFLGTPCNYWDEQFIGKFWGFMETRPFMRAKHQVAMHFLEGIGTADTLKKAEEYFMEMLRLCRGDNIGVRQILPAIFLMLGTEQKCYDFIKWYTCYPDDHYDWGNMELPYLHYKDHNFVDELPSEFVHKYAQIEMVLALALIKFRTLSTLKKSLQSGSDIAVVSPDLRRHLPESLNEDLVREKIQLVQGHLDALFNRVDEHNRRIWRAMINPEPLMSQPEPRFISRNSANEAYSVLRSFLRPWEMTVGAIEYVESRVGKDKQYDAQQMTF
ncbi:hypothetical protein MIR68_002505 [Amoeboaphelidium protococcarum]|nr:hypothetical protein MIR68_002505 [Amoeboaphelidium protococcarum]